MERLEISIINLSICQSILDFRIDASTYKKIYLQEEALLKCRAAERIGTIITSIQNFGAYSLCNEINFVDDGIPFLMTQNVRDNYIDWSGVRNIDNKSHNLLYKSHCSKNQVLITMAGEYLGRAAVYNKDFICSSNQAIAKLTLKPEYSPYYVSSFVNCRYGHNQIARFKTITGQPNINMGLIKYLLIPKVPDEINELIEKSVILAIEKMEEANKKSEFVEHEISRLLNIESWKISSDSTVVRSSKQLLANERWDAEFFQSKYDDFERYIKAYSKMCC